jgi:hypothetical protein
VLYTADDVLADLGLTAGSDDVLTAGRTERHVPPADEHGGDPGAVAWDAVVLARKRV